MDRSWQTPAGVKAKLIDSRASNGMYYIEYTLQNSATPTEGSYRLITTVLDADQAPGLELAALYHERWEIEGVFDEFKTHLRGASTVLRSKTPDLVQQELWGLLLAHFAVRQLMAQAAWQQQLDPDRLSFMHAVRVLKRKMPQAAAVPPFVACRTERNAQCVGIANI